MNAYYVTGTKLLDKIELNSLFTEIITSQGKVIPQVSVHNLKLFYLLKKKSLPWSAYGIKESELRTDDKLSFFQKVTVNESGIIGIECRILKQVGNKRKGNMYRKNEEVWREHRALA